MSEDADRWHADLCERFEDHLARAESLVEQFVTVYEARRGRGAPTTSEMDVLRAAVVLLHAALEELARSCQEYLLPEFGGADVLNAVPFPLLGDRTAEKIGLGTLQDEYGRSTVGELVAAAVRRRCERSSYNNLEQLARAFREVRVEVEFAGTGSDLAALMSRRHQIAHRGDRPPFRAPGARRVQPLARGQVETWIAAVRAAGAAILPAVRRALTDLNDPDDDPNTETTDARP